MQNKSTYLIAGVLIVAAVLFLLISSTGSSAHYYLTIEEVRALDAATPRAITVSGAVLGESIVYDAPGAELRFTIVQIPADPREVERAGGIEQALHAAAQDPAAPRLEIVYRGSPPDMLRHEAQAIVRGRLGADGRFYAEELLLKCPSRYEE